MAAAYVPALSVSSAALAVAISVLVGYVVHGYVVHPLLLSPLARLPSAHWSSALSPLWILRARRSGCENAVLQDAHRRLGPIVRVGPNDVSINDVDMVRTVYGGGFARTHWYSVFDNYGVPCMFSVGPGREHALRKRMVSHVYSKSSLFGSVAVAAQTRAVLLQRLLPILDSSVATTQAPHGIDVFPLFLAASMDCIAAFVWGLCGGTDFLRRPAYRDHWLRLYLSRHGSPFFPQELPRLTRLLRRCGISPYPRWVDWANQELGAWNQTLCRNATTALDLDGSSSSSSSSSSLPQDDPAVLRALLDGIRRESETSGPASLLQRTMLSQPTLAVASELFDHVLAGHETTGIALTYLAWHLSRRRHVQQLLQAELKRLLGLPQLPPPADFLPHARRLDTLPVLHAVILETLRLHAPIPGPQPRETPPAGCRLGPYHLPGGVRIAAAAYTLHRHAHVFPDPEVWDYRRWLDDENDGDDTAAAAAQAKRARTRQFWAFGSGGRMCIGSNFAMHEMKMVAATIYSRFTTYIVDDTGIKQTDSYTSRPTSEQLYLRFEPLLAQ